MFLGSSDVTPLACFHTERELMIFSMSRSGERTAPNRYPVFTLLCYSPTKHVMVQHCLCLEAQDTRNIIAAFKEHL